MKKNCYGLLVALLMCASVGLSWQPLCGEPRGMAHKIQKIRRSDVHLRNVRKPVKSAPQKNARTIRLSVWDSIATQIAAEAGKEKHLKLISGLDEQSIATVNRIISRCQQVQKNQKVFANEQECQILLDMQSNFWDKITRTADGNFAWKQYILPVNHFESQIFYDEMHIDRLKTLNNIRNKDIIDAGAFVGDSALILSPHTNGKIFAFEPVSKTYALLQETIKINNLRNIISVNMGLGDKNEVSSICVRGSGSSFVFNESSVKASDIEGGIQVTTIDDFVAKNNLQIGLIKADIEGFEQYMLRGAEKTIKEQKPILMICIYHNSSDFFDIKPWIESLNLGYKFRIIKPVNRTVLLETVLIAEVI